MTVLLLYQRLTDNLEGLLKLNNPTPMERFH